MPYRTIDPPLPEWFSCPVCRLSWLVPVAVKGFGPFGCAEDRVRLVRGGPKNLPPTGTPIPRLVEPEYFQFSPDFSLALHQLARVTKYSKTPSR